MIRIDIVDDNLRERTGHYFDFCFQMAREFKQAGFDIRVWGANDSSGEVVQYFDQLGVAYYKLPGPPSLASQWHIEEHARCLATALEETSTSGLVFFPTLTAESLLAVSMLRTTPRTVGLVHHDPFFERPGTTKIWRNAAANLCNRDITIGAMDPLIGGFLQSYLGDWPVMDMPMPIGGCCKSDYYVKPQTIGFFGHQREERGGSLIPTMSQLLLQAGYKVLIHDTRGQFRIDGSLPGVRLVNGYADDLGQLMKECDMVVCPMDRSRYLHRTSGIACTAIANGIPLVLPAGTLSAFRLHGFGSSRCYDESTPNEIMQAIQEIAGDYARHTECAQRAARQWGKKHGVKNLFDFCCRLIS